MNFADHIEMSDDEEPYSLALSLVEQIFATSKDICDSGTAIGTPEADEIVASGIHTYML